jgi:signal transduction histidine kinase
MSSTGVPPLRAIHVFVGRCQRGQDLGVSTEVQPPPDAYASAMTGPRRLSLAAVVLTAAPDEASALVVATALQSATGLALLAASLLFGGVPALAGFAIARKQPDNILGLLVVLPGLCAALVLCGVIVDLASATTLPGDDYVTVASEGGWVLAYVVLAVPLLFFPGGRLANRAGRWLLAAILVDAVLIIVVFATAPGPFLPPNEATPHVYGTMPKPLSDGLAALSLPGLPITLVALIVHLVGRYRASDSGRRRQFRWLTLGATLLPVTLLGTWVSYALFGNADVVLAVGFAAMFLMIPVVIAVAEVRPDLFDVDRVIASTATHAVGTTLLLAVFTGVNLLAGLVLVDSAPVVAVGAVALVAVVLAPARARLQGRVDRWLYPARKAAHNAIDVLHADTVAARARPEQLQLRLREALRDPTLMVGYLTPVDGELVDADGAPLRGLDQLPSARAVDVSLGAERIGVLAARESLSIDLLRDVGTRAAPLVELVRLRLDLHRALRDVADSRARMLRVGYEERARLERDLHDGAQQRLVALGMALRLAQLRMSQGIDMSGVLEAAVTQLGTAVSELRQLAHGIRPSCLDDGLVPALSTLVTSTPIPVTLQVTAADLDPDLETTAYYVAAEAITNAVKHASAQSITLDVWSLDGELRVRITDDGSGQAAPREGSGLAGLQDRVGAHGGRLVIQSPRGRGTTIEAVLPCASS